MAYAQTEEAPIPKWKTGFSIGGGLSSMSYVAVNTNNNFSGVSNAQSDRSWIFGYQSGFAMGLMLRQNSQQGRFSFQGEFNLVLSRQKAELTDIPLSTTAVNNFQTVVESRGSAQFNMVYLQIPALLSMYVDASTSIEGGIFINTGLVNNNSQDMTTTTFVERDNRTFQFNRLTPPRVQRSTTQPALNTNWGWLLGVHHDITKNVALRLRYENGMSGISDFKDLREQRLFVGVVLTKK